MESHLLNQLDRMRYKINLIHRLQVQQRKNAALSNSGCFVKLNPVPSLWASVPCFAVFCFRVIGSNEEAFPAKFPVIEKTHRIRPLFTYFLFFGHIVSLNLLTINGFMAVSKH